MNVDRSVLCHFSVNFSNALPDEWMAKVALTNKSLQMVQKKLYKTTIIAKQIANAEVCDKGSGIAARAWKVDQTPKRPSGNPADKHHSQIFMDFRCGCSLVERAFVQISERKWRALMPLRCAHMTNRRNAGGAFRPY